MGGGHLRPREDVFTWGIVRVDIPDKQCIVQLSDPPSADRSGAAVRRCGGDN